MPDFSQLLRKPAADIKRPPALPPGDYLGVIKSYELGDQNKNKTPYVRFQVGLMGWPDAVPEDERTGIDLSKKQLRRDFYLTDDADWRLKEFLESCGIKFDNFETGVPEAIGAQVTVEVQQYMNQTNSEIGNQVGKMVGSQG